MLVSEAHALALVVGADLKVREVTQDLVILLINAQSILVALDGLIIVQVCSIYQPAHKHPCSEAVSLDAGYGPYDQAHRIAMVPVE